jgi:hypothetical protein
LREVGRQLLDLHGKKGVIEVGLWFLDLLDALEEVEETHIFQS